MELMIYHHAADDAVIESLESGNRTGAMRGIIAFSERRGVTENGVREYVITRLADDENILSELAQSGRQIGESLYQYALADIRQIQEKILSGENDIYTPSGNFTGFFDGYERSIRALMEADSPEKLLDMLIAHYRALGCGIFSKYIAFKFDEKGIHGIGETDKITFDDLVGLDYQKQVLSDNTRAFVRGKRANNVLLFGDRGSGKSSSVKALLNLYYQDGLRIIEIPKQHIRDIPSLSRTLAGKPHKYIIFLDDLSFESHETDYRALKVAMEGQLQANPENVLIYATSNRRHLIKENWSDREGGEVHVNDNLQETLSLSERFGISLVFSSPSSQKEYLNIVKELLKVHGVEITPQIEQKAVIWQMNYGSRSARCANQFVASYIANLD